MTRVLLAVYLIIGLLVSHYYLTKVTKNIKDEIKSGEVGRDSESIISETERLSSAVGHKNFIVLTYIMFSIIWLPAIIYTKIIK